MAAFFGIRFDLRDPGLSGVPRAERYAAALDMAEWADRLGFVVLSLSEHHGSPDGYLPSPLPMAAAVAVRTQQIPIMVAAIIPSFHDPIRLAEDLAVVDLLAPGRINVILANGYVPDEFEMFGVPLKERAGRTREAVQVLRQAWTGEPFEHRGRSVRVTPPPATPGGPALILGGTSDAAARRAAELGLGYQPSSGESWPAYRDACIVAGQPDPGPYLSGDATITIVAEDPDSMWDRVGPYLMHDAAAYGEWAEKSGVATGYRAADTVDELRASGQHRIVTPDALVDALAGQPLPFAMFHPLCGGIPPELAWESLRLVEHEVLPRV